MMRRFFPQHSQQIRALLWKAVALNVALVLSVGVASDASAQSSVASIDGVLVTSSVEGHPTARGATTSGALVGRFMVAQCRHDLRSSADALGRLLMVNPQRIGKALWASKVAESTLASPIRYDTGPRLFELRALLPSATIVVLGAGLFPHGHMRPVLMQRLIIAHRVARQYPFASIIVTGGAPQQGVTEAAAMKKWLVGHGVPAQRIATEARSSSTVQNALFTAPLLKARGSSTVLLITSENHIRRAVSDFKIVLGPLPQVFGLAANHHRVAPPSNRCSGERRAVFADAAALV